MGERSFTAGMGRRDNAGMGRGDTAGMRRADTAGMGPGDTAGVGRGEWIDLVGLETLELFSNASAFNAWMFGRVRPHCRGKVLEAGSGIGNLSRFFLDQYNSEVCLSDALPGYVEILTQTFGGDPNLERVFALDLASPDLQKDKGDLLGRFDTVVALNVIEHIDDHALAIRNCRELLGSEGRFIVLVPAYPELYNKMDEELGHFRRYRKKELVDLLGAQGFQLVHLEYFNAAAILGWWVTGRLLGMRRLQNGPLALYNRMAPLMQMVDRILGRKTGLSLIAVGEKKR